MFDDNFLIQLIIRLAVIAAIGFFLYFLRYVLKLIIQRTKEPSTAGIFSTLITLGVGVIIWLIASSFFK